MTQAQHMAEMAAIMIVAVPPEKQIEAIETILGEYIDGLISEFPSMNRDTIRTEAANFYAAIASSAARLTSAGEA